MRKILIAALFAGCAMPTQAFTYVRYETSGLGEATIYEGSGPVFIPMTFKMTAIVPTDSSCGWFDCTIDGSSFRMNLTFDPGTSFSINFDHDLDGIPLTTEGLRGIEVSEGIWPGGVFRGTSTWLKITPFEQDEEIPYWNFIDLKYAAPAPEPATWAMMIGGFALAGAAMRRRKIAATYA